MMAAITPVKANEHREEPQQQTRFQFLQFTFQKLFRHDDVGVAPSLLRECRRLFARPLFGLLCLPVGIGALHAALRELTGIAAS